MIVGLEKMMYSTFIKEYTIFRKSMINQEFVSLDSKIQLPNNSVIHLLDNMIRGVDSKDMPEITNIFLINEIYNKFIYHNSHIVTPDDKLYRKTSSRYITSGLPRTTQEFTKMYRTMIRPVVALDSVVDRTNALLVINHNPLWRFKVMGKLAAYHRFDIIFRSIVTQILSIPPGKHQFIYAPISSQFYSKTNIQRPLKIGATQATLASTNDDYLFLLYLLGVLYPDDGSTSVLFAIKDEYAPFINVILTIANKAMIFNIADMKEMINNEGIWLTLLKRINELKELGGKSSEIVTTLSDTEPEEEVNIDTPITSPAPNTTVAVDTKTTDTKVEKPIVPKIDVVSKKDLDDPKFIPEVPKVVHKPGPPEDIITEIDTKAKVVIDKSLGTPAQKIRHETLANKYKEIKFENSTIGEILKTPIDNTISSTPLNFLSSTIPDPSMMKSSIIDLDKEYIEKRLKKDMISVLVSFNKNGMFLTELEEKKQVDELNKIVKYKATYQDINGRKQSVAYKFPVVAPDGTFTVNGITSRMTKQQINVPICKISPTRVSLAASYKTLVQRDLSNIRSYKTYIRKCIEKSNTISEVVKYKYGTTTYAVKLPYEYTTLGNTYTSLNIGKYHLSFKYNDRGELGRLDLESKYGVLVGRITGNENLSLYMGMNNRIYVVNTVLDTEVSVTSIPELFSEVSGTNMPVTTEWTDIKILDQKLPIIFVLGYKYGLSNILKYLTIDYRTYPKGTMINTLPTDIVIRFADKTFVINRYPLEHSLIISGLASYKTNDFEMESFDKPDVYYDLLLSKGISVNYIKGIDTFFELWLDPITANVLREMGEPTNTKDLLIRASGMLATEECIEPSSMRNHRLRTYDRFNSILYDEMARKLATQRAHNRGDKFSINPEAVFQRIIQDQSVIIVEEINPIHDIKEKTKYTHTGVGGRTATSFVESDRKYPNDGVGIISEATPDSGKVSITAYTTMDPTINNIYGLYAPTPDKIEPTQLLSVTGLLMPKIASDDKQHVLLVSNN